MYGGKVINTGDPVQFKKEHFVNSYQNEDVSGKKQFVMLWLHAYKYAYKTLTVETELPEWARLEFRMPGSEANDDNENSPARNVQSE